MTKLTPAYYLTITGRISPREYWLYFQLPALIVYIMINITLPAALWLYFQLPALIVYIMINITLPAALAIIIAIVFLGFFIIAIMGGVRRFHDRDKSGWWMLIALIPIVGGLWLLVELGFQKGTTGPNRFGADPTVG